MPYKPDLDYSINPIINSVLESNITDDLLNIIENHYGKSENTDRIVNTIQAYAIKIFEFITPILIEDEDIVIILRCSKRSISSITEGNEDTEGSHRPLLRKPRLLKLPLITDAEGEDSEGSEGSEGITEGISEGITEGISEGITEGITEGISEGITEGITEGTEGSDVTYIHDDTMTRSVS